jgi:hypothetical protein
MESQIKHFLKSVLCNIAQSFFCTARSQNTNVSALQSKQQYEKNGHRWTTKVLATARNLWKYVLYKKSQNFFRNLKCFFIAFDFLSESANPNQQFTAYKFSNLYNFGTVMSTTAYGLFTRAGCGTCPGCLTPPPPRYLSPPGGQEMLSVLKKSHGHHSHLSLPPPGTKENKPGQHQQCSLGQYFKTKLNSSGNSSWGREYCSEGGNS